MATYGHLLLVAGSRENTLKGLYLYEDVQLHCATCAGEASCLRSLQSHTTKTH